MKLRAEGGESPASIDADAVRRAVDLLLPPGGTFEVRGLPSGRFRICRTADDAIAAARAFVNDRATYYTLNPCREDLDHPAHEGDILGRTLLLIDIDALGDRDNNATEAEKQEALSLAGAVQAYLTERGWPRPAIVDSGNGCHLLYRLDEPATNLTKQIVKRVLLNLGELFNNPGAAVDRSVHNHARISKLPGTWSRKAVHSAERPHRPCRFIDAPEVLEPVPSDLLRVEAGLEAPASEPDPPTVHVPALSPLKLKATTRSGVEHYVRRALESEAVRIMLTPPGERHTALRNGVYAIAGYLWTGKITEFEIRRHLRAAAQSCKLPDREIDDLIESGLAKGKEAPRKLPGELDQEARGEVKRLAAETNGTGAHGEEEAPSRLIIWASEVKTKKVEWLWPGRIPLGKMTTFAGQGGLGKTFVLCDLAARVSTEGELPLGNGECIKGGKVLFISAEDDEDDTLVPRLIECGADLRNIAFLSAPTHDNFDLSALNLLTSVLDQMKDVRFVAIDPPTSYLNGIDDHNNVELRSVLRPLKDWASQQKVSVVFNTHVNKAMGGNIDAAMRVMGSVAWVNAVRSAHMFAKDPDDEDEERVVFATIKINNGKKRKALTYRIDSIDDERAKVQWIAVTDQTADQVIKGIKKKPRGVVATEWLAERFREKAEWPSDELIEMGKEDNISRSALFSPEVNGLPIEKKPNVRADGTKYYVWRVKRGANWPPRRGEIPETPEIS
ncbi:MAG: AAA family ATPase [Phycisphaerales bacterium]